MAARMAPRNDEEHDHQRRVGLEHPVADARHDVAEHQDQDARATPGQSRSGFRGRGPTDG